MSLLDYLNQGGIIMYILLVLNIVGLATMANKFFEFLTFKRKQNSVCTSIVDLIPNNNASEDTVLELVKQEVNRYISKMEVGLSTIKIIASISPLLGLLGTVVGVLSAFKVMSETGTNNPASFASGIYLALITTVGGLIVSIPHTIGHSYLLRLLDKIETTVEHDVVSAVFNRK